MRKTRLKHARIIIVTMAVLVLTAIVLAHGGGLDSQGGHHDRKRGGYHFHRGSLAGEYYASKAAASAALREYRDRHSDKKPSERKKPDDPKPVVLTADQRLDVLVRLLETKQVLRRGEFKKTIEEEIERRRRRQ